MRNLVAFPLLGLAVILQSSVISQIRCFPCRFAAGHVAAWALQQRVKSPGIGRSRFVMLGFVSKCLACHWLVTWHHFVAQALQRCMQSRYCDVQPHILGTYLLCICCSTVLEPLFLVM
jgi:hypothetical protein